jgi:branched-subunit amino acid ABC-type transport system permease component
MYFLQIFLNSIVHGTQILLIAVPLYLIYSVSRTFHLAVGAISTAVAYGFYYAFIHSGSIAVAIFASLIASISFAFISHLILESYILKNQNLLALLVSFSMGTALEALIAMGFGSDGKSIVQEVLPVFHFFSLNLTLVGLITILFGITFFLLSAFFVIKTPFGRTLRSLSENSSSSESLGTNSQYMRFVTYLIAIFMAGFVGIMSGLNTSLTPSMGFNNVILAFIAFLIGGTYSIAGAFVASFLVTFIPQLIVSYTDFSDSWRMAFVFLLAGVLLAIRPNGLFYSRIRNN